MKDEFETQESPHEEMESIRAIEEQLTSFRKGMFSERLLWVLVCVCIGFLSPITYLTYTNASTPQMNPYAYRSTLPPLFENTTIGRLASNQTDSFIQNTHEAPQMIQLESPSQKPLNAIEIKKLKNTITLLNGITIDQEGFQQGSGVFISEDGWMLTNYHVIQNTESLAVMWKSCTETDCRLRTTEITKSQRACEPRLDICLLHVPVDKPVQYAKLHNEYPTMKNRVIAVGNPDNQMDTYSEGEVLEKPSSHFLLEGLDIQHTAQISAGSSGGGLFDENGNLVGITTAKSKKETDVSYAVSSEKIHDWITELIQITSRYRSN